MNTHDLPSLGYRQLAAAYTDLETRRSWPGHPLLDTNVSEIVDAVRAKHDPTVRALIERIQVGDHAAGVVTLWALHERLRALVGATIRYDTDRAAMFDDHLTIAWWVLHDADPSERSLGERVLSRTWRRYDRLYRRLSKTEGQEMPDLAGADDPTVERVLARGDLQRVLDAVRASSITQAEWCALLTHRVDGEHGDRPMSPSARRQLVYRTTAKLRHVNPTNDRRAS
ncbi:MAG: hypothetical protein AB7L13_12355 [Acidimicrobiia bacterium]